MPLKRPPTIRKTGRGVRYGAKTVTFARNGGVEAAIAKLEKAAGKRARVAVGLPLGSGEYPDGTSVISVGVTHEFGDPSQGIPMRSFLRAGISDANDEIRKAMRELGRAAREGEISTENALAKLGTLAVSAVQRKIESGPFVPNSPETIARKGSSSPLQDTALLKQSITYEVRR